MNETNNSGPNKTSVAASLLVLYLAWSSTYFAIRVALESFPPFFIAGFRYMLIGLGICLFFRLRGAPLPTLREWGGSAVAGSFLLLGGTGGVVYAEQWVGSGIAAVVLATTPLLTALFAALWKHRPAQHEWIGMLLGLAGIVLLNIGGDLRAYPLGAALLVLAAFSWSFGSVLSLHIPMPPGMMAGGAQMFSGGAITLLASIMTNEKIPEHPSMRALAAMVWLAVFGSLLGYSAYTYLLKNVRPALATSYAYVNPVLAVLIGVWLGGEQLTPLGITAMTVIIAAVFLVVMGRRK